MPICCPRRSTAWRRSGSRRARRPTRRATSMRAAACGGICFAVGRRWRAETAWRSFARRRRAGFATCGDTPPTFRRRWRPRFRRASSASRAAGPESMARLAAMLGSPTRSGKGALADCLARAGRPTVHWTTTVRSIRRSNRTPLWLAGAVCCLAAAVAILWPVWHGRRAGRFTAQSASAKPQAVSKLRAFTRSRKRLAVAHPRTHRIAPRDRASTTTPLCRPRSSSRCSRRPISCLPADKPLAATSLDLRAGQCVRAASGQRAMLLVPRSRPGRRQGKRPLREHRLRVGATHRRQIVPGRKDRRSCGCWPAGRSSAAVRSGAVDGDGVGEEASHRRSLPSPLLPSAGCIRPSRPVGNLAAQRTDPTGRLPVRPRRRGPRLPHGRSAGHRVDQHAAPRRRAVGAAGPLSAVGRAGVAQPVASHAARRRAAAGVSGAARRASSRCEITVLATACVFAPEPGEPLVRCSGSASPERLLRGLRWTGQGSLVTPHTPILAWRGPDGQQQTVDESSLSIAGLVRSEVGFAGGPSSDPAASRVIRWQAPLQSANPPGIDPAPLPCPGR